MAVNLAGGYRVPRHAPVVDQVYLQAVDMSGASTLKAQVRLAPEAGGSPLIDLATVETAGTQGFRFIAVDTTSAPYPISQFELCIDKTTMVGLPLAAEPDDDACFVWDFHLIPSGGVEQASNVAPFIVAPGSTL